MSRKRLTHVPSLEVAAFLFPKKEFYNKRYSCIRFRVSLEAGQLTAEWRRHDKAAWEPLGAVMTRQLRINQHQYPELYKFTAPVEIDTSEEP